MTASAIELDAACPLTQPGNQNATTVNLDAAWAIPAPCLKAVFPPLAYRAGAGSTALQPQMSAGEMRSHRKQQ